MRCARHSRVNCPAWECAAARRRRRETATHPDTSLYDAAFGYDAASSTWGYDVGSSDSGADSGDCGSDSGGSGD
jgi:hypothetical protein